jgi:hypothetical protein
MAKNSRSIGLMIHGKWQRCLFFKQEVAFDVTAVLDLPKKNGVDATYPIHTLTRHNLNCGIGA